MVIAVGVVEGRIEATGAALIRRGATYAASGACDDCNFGHQTSAGEMYRRFLRMLVTFVCDTGFNPCDVH